MYFGITPSFQIRTMNCLKACFEEGLLWMNFSNILGGLYGLAIGLKQGTLAFVIG